MHELDIPKLIVTLVLGLFGLAVGVMAWVSMPADTGFLVQALLWVFVAACIIPIFAVLLNWRAGLGLSVVVALGTVIALQLVLKKPDVAVLRQVVAQEAAPIAAPVVVPEAEVMQPQVFKCAGGEINSLGQGLIYRNRQQTQSFFVGRMVGEQFTMNPLSAEEQTLIQNCMNNQGQTWQQVYRVKP